MQLLSKTFHPSFKGGWRVAQCGKFELEKQRSLSMPLFGAGSIHQAPHVAPATPTLGSPCSRSALIQI